MIGALIGRVLTHHSLGMETVVTNIPGPQFPLYSFGRKMIASYPYVPVSGRTRVGIAVFSYLGSLHFGVSADADAGAHLEVLCQGYRGRHGQPGQGRRGRGRRRSAPIRVVVGRP